MSKKAAYIEKAQAKLDEQIANLNRLKAKAQGEVLDQKLKSQEKIEELEAKIKNAKAHLTEITNAAEDAWENIRSRFDHLADDIGSSFKKFFGKDDPDSDSKNAEFKDKE